MITLKYYEQLTVCEIAERMKHSYKAIGMQPNRALKKLFRDLGCG